MGIGASSTTFVISEDLHNNAEVYDAVIKGLAMAMELINKRGDEVIKIIAKVEGINEEEASEYLNWEGTNYTQDLYALSMIGEFMAKNQYIRNGFQGFEYYTWENAVEVNASN